MNKKRTDAEIMRQDIDITCILSIIALVIGIVALLNPHFVEEIQTRSKTIEVVEENRFVIYENGDTSNLIRMYSDIKESVIEDSIDYDCTEGVEIDNQLENPQTLHYVIFSGSGVCRVYYRTKVTLLKWG